MDGWLVDEKCVNALTVCQKGSSIYFIFKYVNESDFYLLIYTIPLRAGSVLGAVLRNRGVRFWVRVRSKKFNMVRVQVRVRL